MDGEMICESVIAAARAKKEARYPIWLDRLTPPQRHAALRIREEFKGGSLTLSARSLAKEFVDRLAADGVRVASMETVRVWLAN